MKFEASTKTAEFDNRPRIPKGYYPAKVVDIKPRKDGDDNWILGSYNQRQIVVLFTPWKTDKNGNPTEPFKIGDSEHDVKDDRKEDDLVIASVLNSEYPNDKNDTSKGFRSAFTPKSRITQVFKTLGWEGPQTGSIDVDKYLGAWCEVNIDDYEVEVEDGENYKASSIKDVNEWEGETPSSGSKKKQKKKKESKENTKESSDIETKVKELKALREKEQLSKEGFEQAIEQLKEQDKDAVEKALKGE